MNSDPTILAEESHSYPLMSGWPYSTSAMPGPWFGQNPVGAIIPKVDIIETDSSVIYIFDLAGADSSKIELEISASEISIKAPVATPDNKHLNDRYIYQERPKGTYARLLAPPANVNLDEVKADFKDGILKVNFPKLSRRS
ncbi:MAG: Spore protein SP21 [Pelotomaculum sp. PtaU1.Bin035]|nr:MAG: Spore protein SP21 [Pelotomaculum sp. PtaU1.Bin035]